MFLDTRLIQNANIRSSHSNNTSLTSPDQFIPSLMLPTLSTSSSASSSSSATTTAAKVGEPPHGQYHCDAPIIQLQQLARKPTVFKRFKSKLVVKKKKEKNGCKEDDVVVDDNDDSGSSSINDNDRKKREFKDVCGVPGSAGCSNDITDRVQSSSGSNTNTTAVAVSIVTPMTAVSGESVVKVPLEDNNNPSSSSAPSSSSSSSKPDMGTTTSDSEFVSAATKMAHRFLTTHSSCHHLLSQFFPLSSPLTLTGSPDPSTSTSTGAESGAGAGSGSGQENENDNSRNNIENPITSSSQQQQQQEPNESHFKLVADSLFKLNLNLSDTKLVNHFLTTASRSRPAANGNKSDPGADDSGADDSGADGSGSGSGAGSGASVVDGDHLRDIVDKWARWVIRKRSEKGKGKECRQDSDDEIGHEENENESDGSDSSSVVISCSLDPTNETDVEVARSEVVSVDWSNHHHQQQEQQPPFLPSRQADERNFWSTLRKSIPAIAESSGNVNVNVNSSGSGSNSSSAPPPTKPPRLIKQVRVWYPSRTKVSLEATWWGYRLYLPPPVMQILSDKSLEAAKRAAMITAALTWLVSHIPMELLPPQFKPLSLLFKEIVPLVGYVGGFIAWSWNTVKGFDKGDGVILSATWLLPIALIPGTWTYTEPNCDIPLENVIRHDIGCCSTPPSPSPPPPPPPKDAPSRGLKPPRGT